MTTATATKHTQPCTWIGPEHTRPGHCTHTALAGSSYCELHYPLVYNTGSALRKRKKDIRVKNSLEDLTQMIIDIAEELEDEGWTPEQGTEEEDQEV